VGASRLRVNPVKKKITEHWIKRRSEGFHNIFNWISHSLF